MLTKNRLLQFGSLVARTFAALVLGGCSAPDVSHEDVLGTASSLTLPGVTLQTVLVPRFVGATNNGGGAVNATATVAQAWETFTFQDINGGALMSGDSVFIQAGNGQFFQALNGGGSTLNAGSNNQLGWETFKVVKQSGTGTVNNGDIVGLQDNAGSWVSAANGGGAAVFAYGGALGSWEQFKINGLPAVVAPPPPTPAPPPPAQSPPTGTTIGNVSFRTALQGTYVGAQNNGGGAVIATATAAQAWETFSLIDINGGTLDSGDSVFIQAGNGQFFQALNGGGTTLNAGSNNKLGWETFKIVKKTGSGTINSGDVIGLQASSGAWVSAQNGGGGTVYAYGGALGSWESLIVSVPASSGSGDGAGGSGGSTGGSGGSASGSGGSAGGSVISTPPTPGVVPNFPGTKAAYGNGYSIFNFQANGRNVTVYAPPKPLDGLPWVWHGEFPDVIPNTNNALLAKGLMIVYLDVQNMYGSPEAVTLWDALYATMTTTYHLANKVVITGISRGALYMYDWASANPDKVAGLYADNGTCDFRSWPGGSALGLPQYVGPGSPGDWSLLLQQYHFKSNAEAIAWTHNPVDSLEPLAKAGVPLLHVFADADTALPWTENTGVVADRYPKLGGSITLIRKVGFDHHPHGLEQDPTPVVNFVLTNALRANGLSP